MEDEKVTKIRTRFAPSPTGRMHVGNLRTALYAYLVPDIETGIPDGTASETEGEIYGIGIEKGAGNLFWFHKEVHRTP